MRSNAARGFTLIEAIIVVAIIGIVASLAVPSMLTLSQKYHGIESARSMLYAVSQARAYSQKRGEPFRILIQPSSITIQKSLLSGNVTDLVRTISGFEDFRTIGLGDAVASSVVVNGTAEAPGTAAAAVTFCASGDGHFVTASGPVCKVGDLASSEASVKFKVGGEAFQIDVSAPLGTIDLKRAL